MGFESDTAFTHKVLDVLMLRTNVAAHNLVNQNTPGFKRSAVRFEDLLRDARSRGDQQLEKVDPVITKIDTGGPDDNNVSVYEELSTLKKVELMHRLFSSRASGYFDHLNKAIFGR